MKDHHRLKKHRFNQLSPEAQMSRLSWSMMIPGLIEDIKRGTLLLETARKEIHAKHPELFQH